ncbi:TPM domain-containing protein [Falsihalocynthiibacter sp. SS001]|uniref:TPM domain-containing protein n=1 Tax=Falsihalocynthiibacter sp. SS001 TaxID=3349698 RepID=UPI0036D404F4
MQRIARIIVTVSLLLSAGIAARAQEFPVPDDPYVNDYAAMLSKETEDTLRRKLDYLKQDTGIEMSVLTITSMASFGDWEDIAEFATATFNDWGIGDPELNDGLLMMIAKNDRVFRIVVGSGYPPVYDDISEDIIQFYMEPAFKDGDFDDGVLDGAQKMIELIALRHMSGDEPPARSRRENHGPRIALALFTAFFGTAIAAAIFGPKISNYRFARKPCPSCGQTGMERTSATLEPATRTANGQGETTISCPNCDYQSVDSYSIPRISTRRSSGRSSFSGGSSSGGGASGRW